MKKRRLGQTQFEISAIGLGAWAMGTATGRSDGDNKTTTFRWPPSIGP